jgi:imidazole glycerol-phosphate synthase subunit HisH
MIAVVDYGMGNLFSVKRACEHVGLRAEITHDADVVASADAVILPGVGAFGDAMHALDGMGMSDAIRQVAASGKRILGICLGLQLLMERSCEFGTFDGLGLIPGDVVPFERPHEGDRILKVPQVGWNRVWRASEGAWDDTLLSETPDGVHQYFVHSYYVRPSDERNVAARTRYGDVEFCSAAKSGNVFACQFHPERSGPQGIRMYERFAAMVRD